MSTVARLLARKRALVEHLENAPGPNEHGEIERLLAQIDTALSLVGPEIPLLLAKNDAVWPGDFHPEIKSPSMPLARQ